MVSSSVLTLVPHPAVPAPAGVSVTVTVRRADDGAWQLDYRIEDPHGLIQWPADAPEQATDGLWQHTCCEAFVAVPDSEAYVEFNASPAGPWACYRFAAYRARADQGQPAWRPDIECAHDGAVTTVSVPVPAALLPPAARQAGLSCVIETHEGARSYWALAHPEPQPDFHHRDGFALMLGKE